MAKDPITSAEINEANRKYWADPNRQWEAALRSVVEEINNDRKRGPRAGGKANGASKSTAAAEWQHKCIERARELLEQGKSPRELAGILAPQFAVSTRQIRDVLKKAEVK